MSHYTSYLMYMLNTKKAVIYDRNGSKLRVVKPGHIVPLSLDLIPVHKYKKHLFRLDVYLEN